MGESILQILLILFLNLLPSLWLFLQQELEFPPPSPPKLFPNPLLALTKKLTNISFKILVNALLKLLVCGHIWIPCWNYRKIPKISPSMYKLPQTPMIARQAKDFTWNRGCSSNPPPLKHGDQIPHPLENSDNQIPSSPGRQRCQMPGVCPGRGGEGMLKLRFDRYINL